MHSHSVRREAAALRLEGRTWSEISRALGVSRSSLRAWDTGTRPARASGCSWCEDAPFDEPAYAALLGYYLGDGCLSRAARCVALRVSCDRRYPGIVRDVTECISRVRPERTVFHVAAPGCVVVQSNWQHWPCYFPQHGPGRKHERPIELEDWQRSVVEAHTGNLLRGLFHSDGCRVNNWTCREVAGRPKRYDYPRWQFTNVSADIRALCCWALDRRDIPWRQSNHKTISVSTRAGVAKLDRLIGPKQ